MLASKHRVDATLYAYRAKVPVELIICCLAMLKRTDSVSDKQVSDSASKPSYCMRLLCVTVAPETSWVKTVMLCPAERVFKS